MKLKVTTTKPTFRRGGIEFSREPKIIDTSKLKKKQVEAIRNEPALNIVEVEEKSAPKPPAKKKATGKTADSNGSSAKSDDEKSGQGAGGDGGTGKAGDQE